MRKCVTARAIALAAAVLAVGALSARAAHGAPCAGFTDVQATDNYCAAVEWLENRAITFGCTGTEFCPGAAVTRASMALFMQRLGVALESRSMWTDQSFGGIDVDGPNHVCQSTAVSVSGFPRKARVTGYLSARFGAAGDVSVVPEYSTDGGGTWAALPGIANAAMLGASTAGVPYTTAVLAPDYDLAVGSTYRFALRASRLSGTGDFQSGECQLKVEVLNRNPPSTPYDVNASSH